MNPLAAYIPIDRRHAIAAGKPMADRTRGTCLFADISGFTPLTEALAAELGTRRGAEELTQHLNRIYTALVRDVHAFHGAVIGFAGDAVTCWFEGDKGLQAITAALSMQSDIARLGEIATPGGQTIQLAIKTAVAYGPVRRFLVGDPAVQRLDVLAGNTLAHMAAAEQIAARGDVLITAEVADQMGNQIVIDEWHTDSDGRKYAAVNDLRTPITLPMWPPLPRELTTEELREWILPPVYNHLAASEGGFLAELRPAATLFLYFAGIDFDGDDTAGEKLNAYIRWVQNRLQEQDGYLLQLIMGDKGSYLYAAFGAPISHGNDAAHAVAAGLSLRELPPELNYITDTKIGISQGRMRTGAYGADERQTYGVLGDEVNTSARLMQYAQPGQILISPRVQTAVQQQYRLRDLGGILLKGKAQPIMVSEVLGRWETTAVTAAPTQRLIGRDDILADMRAHRDQAAAGRGQIVRLIGQAGIGKSVLAGAFNHRAEKDGWRVMVGQCQSTTRSTPYYPWRQIFRRLFNLGGDETEGGRLSDKIRRIRTRLRQMNPDWELRLPLLGDLLGIAVSDNAATAGFDPRLRQESLFTLAVDILHHHAQKQPLLVFLDDVHWMDDASRELAVALARATAQHPILLLLMHRPPVDDQPILAPLDNLDNHHRIDLNELAPAAVAALAEARLGDPLAPLAADIIQTQSQGNPFFTEELVTGMREAGQLVPVKRKDGRQWELDGQLFESLLAANCMYKEEGEWHLREEVTFNASDLGMPDSIHGIVLARLDRLAENEKLTVKVASVIGRLFEFNLLQQIHPDQPASAPLREQIVGIENRDFVRVEAPEPYLTYMFRHNTLQEVAYDTLLFAQRRELHCDIAQWYENMFGAETQANKETADEEKNNPLAPFYPLLAYHWRYAEDVNKERHYAVLAGEQAARQFANEDALRYFTRALAIAPDDDWETRYRILLGRESVYDLLGRRTEQKRDLDQLLKMKESLAQNHKFILRLIEYHETLSNFSEAEALAIKLLKETTQEKNLDTHIKSMIHLANAQRDTGRLEESKETLLKALKLTEHLDIDSKIFLALGHTTLLIQKNFQEALNYCQLALNRFIEQGNLKGQSKAYRTLAGIYHTQGNYSQSRILCEKTLGIDQRMGHRRGEVHTLLNLGSLYHATGRLDMAESVMKSAYSLTFEIEDVNARSIASNNLGLVLLEMNQEEIAQKYSREAVEIDEKIGDVVGQGYSLTTLALVFEAQGKLKAAETHFKHAYDIRQEINQVPATLDNLAGLLRISLKQNKPTKTEFYLKETRKLLAKTEGKGTEHLTKVYLSIIQALITQDQLNQAKEHLHTCLNKLYGTIEKLSDEDQISFWENRSMHREVEHLCKKLNVKLNLPISR